MSIKTMQIYAKHITFISAKPFEKTQLDQMYDIYIKTKFMRGPGRCDTSHLSDFNETCSK